MKKLIILLVLLSQSIFAQLPTPYEKCAIHAEFSKGIKDFTAFVQNVVSETPYFYDMTGNYEVVLIINNKGIIEKVFLPLVNVSISRELEKKFSKYLFTTPAENEKGIKISSIYKFTLRLWKI